MEVAREKVRAHELVCAAGLRGDCLPDRVDRWVGWISQPRVHAEPGRADGITSLAGSIDRALCAARRELRANRQHGTRARGRDRLARILGAGTLEDF